MSLAAVLIATPALGAAGWMNASGMAAARASFPAVSLPDGHVLVVSGNSAELFDPSTETFASAGTLTVDRGSGLTATLLQTGKVLIAGGQSGDASTATAELYDPVTSTFVATGSMTVPRSYGAATLLANGKVLITGGHQFNFPNSAQSTAELYDPVSGTFSSTGSMSVARQDQTATLLPDGTVLVAGGYDRNQTALASAEVYDPVTGSFSGTGSMASGRGNHTATLLEDGSVLVAGGHTGFPGGSLASAELYDPVTGTFSGTGSMTIERGAHTATLLPDGTVLIAGGFTAFPFLGTTLSGAEIYDPATGSFSATASMHGARGRHAAALLPGGDVLVAGGISQCCDSGGTSAEVYSSALVDTLPPTITTPGDFSVVAPDAGGTSVSYSVSVTDNVDGNPQLDCQPPSGSTFQLGATTVQCTASDAAGNTAAASFIVTVLPPLDIALLPDRFGGVIPRTGVASVRGSASCNRATHVFVSGELKETVANRGVVDGFYFTEFDCSPPSATWEATVVPTAGSYGAGKATVTGSAFSCDQYFSCDFDQKSAVITLRGR